jgi:hypothetical protein
LEIEATIAGRGLMELLGMSDGVREVQETNKNKEAGRDNTTLQNCGVFIIRGK